MFAIQLCQWFQPVNASVQNPQIITKIRIIFYSLSQGGAFGQVEVDPNPSFKMFLPAAFHSFLKVGSIRNHGCAADELVVEGFQNGLSAFWVQSKVIRIDDQPGASKVHLPPLSVRLETDAGVVP
jgi:hypothetical protein